MTAHEQVQITQADRDAAAAFFRDERTGLAVKFRLSHDPEPLLEAFARHRHTATADALEAVAQTRSANAGNLSSGGDYWRGYDQACLAVYAAIAKIGEDTK